MQIPLVYLYAILPLMGVMMFIRTIQVIHEDILALRVDKPASQA
jgi:TRAP-type C4-dicarboxylate transport system permease small subunit